MRSVSRHSFTHHGKVGLGSFALNDAVNSEGDVRCGKRIAISELHVVANDECPGKTVVRAEIVGREVVLEFQILVGRNKRRLNKGLMDMLAATPRTQRVETGGRLAASVHGHDNLVGSRSAFAALRRRPARACRKHTTKRCDGSAARGQLQKIAPFAHCNALLVYRHFRFLPF